MKPWRLIAFAIVIVAQVLLVAAVAVSGDDAVDAIGPHTPAAVTVDAPEQLAPTSIAHDSKTLNTRIVAPGTPGPDLGQAVRLEPHPEGVSINR